MVQFPVSDTDIVAAAKRLKGSARVTPLLEHRGLSDMIGRRTLFKAECLQVGGAFKFRGALNAIASLPENARKRGVIAYSSGNHAQAVAISAAQYGIPATIIMPDDAPTIKREMTEAAGATVVPYDRKNENREAIGEKLASEKGLSLIRPYDQTTVIAGQGTVGCEIASQCAALGIAPAAVIAPAGGGGLVAGTALAMRTRVPHSLIYAAEPIGHNDLQRSLTAGKRLSNPAEAPATLCDALMTPTPGEITFPINQQLLTGALTASEDATVKAVRLLFHYLKLVVEPGGAVGLAAMMETSVPGDDDQPVVVVLSGGNIDPALYARLLGGAGRNSRGDTAE